MLFSRRVLFPFYVSFLKQRNNVFAVSAFNSIKLNSSLAFLQKNKLRMYTVEERGSLYSPDYRVFFKNENGPVSPLHDIPLFADAEQSVYNMVVEIPRWTNAKMEICLSEPLNPMKQDVKKGVVRFVSNVFPHHGYIWNYGALPQTWENPHHIDPATQARGDNDPIDILEIGERVARRGEVVQVKVVGTLAMIDEGETDWKLLAIDVRDPKAALVNDVSDVETHFPGLLKATVEWFKLYKVPDGKPHNQFAFNGEAKDAKFAKGVINETHEFWKGLMAKEQSDIDRMNVSVEGSAYKVEPQDAAAVLSKAPLQGVAHQLPAAVDKWHFLSVK